MGTPRRLVIDGASFCWTRSHGRREIDDHARCVERFSAWRDDDRRGALRVCFVDGEGGSTTAGQGWGGHDGQRSWTASPTTSTDPRSRHG
ncbi:hypothetical protein [Nannocystis pusilla]|uniref:hypothetical protein n=1 Tax=Nannocystis pusilla TaxID=889268 RepID=UPI003DA4813B